MIRRTLITLWLGATLAAGCGAEVTDEEDEPILLGQGGGGIDPDHCPPIQEYCSGSVVKDEDGCDVCEPDSCAKCDADEACITCNSAVGSTYGCQAIVEPNDDQFACKWTVCAVGEVCQDVQPAGDGCPGAQCAALPASCESDPTCACLEQAFGANGCSEDEDGNVTVTGSYF